MLVVYIYFSLVCVRQTTASSEAVTVTGKISRPALTWRACSSERWNLPDDLGRIQHDAMRRVQHLPRPDRELVAQQRSLHFPLSSRAPVCAREEEHDAGSAFQFCSQQMLWCQRGERASQ